MNLFNCKQKTRSLLWIFSIVILLFSAGCSKKALLAQNKSLLEQYFEDNILNKDFVVQLASDNSVDITTQFSGFVYNLTKGATAYDGPMVATNGSQIINGTWSSNDDYSKLVITLTTSLSSFTFLNREWRFTKKTLPIMELAPWGAADPLVLHMERL